MQPSRFLSLVLLGLISLAIPTPEVLCHNTVLRSYSENEIDDSTEETHNNLLHALASKWTVLTQAYDHFIEMKEKNPVFFYGIISLAIVLVVGFAVGIYFIVTSVNK